MDATSNVSRRLRRVRIALALACRAFDRAAGRPEGTCAIIEARDTDDITRLVAQSYATAAGVEVAWLMLGAGPMIGGRPDLDPSNPSHQDLIAEVLRGKVGRPRPIGADHTASDFAVEPTSPVVVRDGFDQRTGTEG